MGRKTEAVFDTAELLESILHGLPTKDLLFAQGVCKRWKEVIDGSPKLQRALFFKPVDVELLTLKRYDPKRKAEQCWSTSKHEAYRVYENPLFSSKLEDIRMMPSGSPPTPHWACFRPEASWRRMLLTQPAIELVYVSVFSSTTSLQGQPLARFGAKEYRAARLLQEVYRWYANDSLTTDFPELDGVDLVEQLEYNGQIELLQVKDKSGSEEGSELCN